MYRQRDSFLLLICLVPAVILLYGFFTWQNTGAWPYQVPNPDLPNVALPAYLQASSLPPGVRQALSSFSQNWFTIVLGTAIGVVSGILLIGIVADSVKALFGMMRPQSSVTDQQPPAEDDPFDDQLSEVAGG